MPEKAQLNNATFSSFVGQIMSNEEMAQMGQLKGVQKGKQWEIPRQAPEEGKSKASPHQPPHLPNAGDSQQRKRWHGARWAAQARQVTLASVEWPETVAAGWGPLASGCGCPAQWTQQVPVLCWGIWQSHLCKQQAKGQKETKTLPFKLISEDTPTRILKSKP